MYICRGGWGWYVLLNTVSLSVQRCQILWSWRYRLLWDTCHRGWNWTLIPLQEQAHALNHWAFSPDLSLLWGSPAQHKTPTHCCWGWNPERYAVQASTFHWAIPRWRVKPLDIGHISTFQLFLQPQLEPPLSCLKRASKLYFESNIFEKSQMPEPAKITVSTGTSSFRKFLNMAQPTWTVFSIYFSPL